MGNFDESKVNRNHGKFAPKSTSETELADFHADLNRQSMEGWERTKPSYDHGFGNTRSQEEAESHLDYLHDRLDEDIDNGYVSLRRSRVVKDRMMSQFMNRSQFLQRATPEEIADVPDHSQVGDATPFGTITQRKDVAPGIAEVTTDRGGSEHGGYVLSGARRTAMGPLATEGRFYEAEGADALVRVRFSEDLGISGRQRTEAAQEAQTYFPDRMKAFESFDIAEAPYAPFARATGEFGETRTGTQNLR